MKPENIEAKKILKPTILKSKYTEAKKISKPKILKPKNIEAGIIFIKRQNLNMFGFNFLWFRVSRTQVSSLSLRWKAGPGLVHDTTNAASR